MRCAATVAILLLHLVCGVGRAAADCVDYSDYLHWAARYVAPGYAYNVTVVDDFAYLAYGTSGLRIVNVADPGLIVPAGAQDTNGTSYDVAVEGDLAYVADGDRGLCIIDVANPEAPYTVGGIDTPGTARAVSIAGGFAYIADAAAGLQVIDISVPGTPYLAATMDTPGNALGVAVADHYAYVADGATGLIVIDIADPTSPQMLGTANTPVQAYDVVVAGAYAYVADYGYSNGVKVIDISNPNSPIIVASPTSVGYPKCVELSGSTLYVGVSNSVYIFDVTNPLLPATIEELRTGDGVTGACARPGFVFVANSSTGLQLYAASTPIQVDPTMVLNTAGSATDLVTRDGIGYLADGSAGMQVLSLSDPTNPQILATVDTPGTARGVAVDGGYAYVADESGGLEVVDITNVQFPSIVANVPITEYDYVQKVAISGTHAYAAATYGVWVVDIADPMNPVREQIIDATSYTNDVICRDNLLYVGGGEQVTILDIANPSAPVALGSVSVANAFDLALSGRYLYAACYGAGVQVIDVIDPAAPTVTNAAMTPAASSVSIAGNHAYVSDALLGMVVLDLSNELGPRISGGIAMSGGFVGVTANVDAIYLMASSAGVVVAPTQCANGVLAWWNLQSPASQIIERNTPSAPIFGRARVDGLGIVSGAALGLAAQCGYGPDGSDPAAASDSWHWQGAAFNQDVGDDDEFVATLTVPDEGTYDYCYRYAYLGGEWQYGDLTGSADGYSAGTAGSLSVVGSVAVPGDLPKEWRLFAATPNPFNPTTRIRYDVPQPAMVAITIYTVKGERVARLVAEYLPAGRYDALWSGCDERGAAMPSGTYLCRLSAGHYVATRQLTLVK